MPPPDVLQIGDVITHTSSPSAAASCSGLSPGVERQTRILHPLRSSRATAHPRTGLLLSSSGSPVNGMSPNVKTGWRCQPLIQRPQEEMGESASSWS
jgi:hypothetical protein